ncbi:MAG: hypothetical protein ABSE39_11505 [Candidatus Bathyarchaeia archaeon]|jgi:uncharacterized membrane protein
MSSRFSKNRRKVIVVFVILIVLCETIAYLATTPRPTEQFFQLYVLGADHTISHYYPNDNMNISPGERVAWYLGVVNNMGTVQFISIRVKISNATVKPPDDQQIVESPAPVVTDFARFLEDNETYEIPFVWSISNATQNGGTTRILTLQIDNETYQISDWSARNGYNFRLIFELWTWQTDINAFEYGWNTIDMHHAAWVQLWFNMTSAPYISQ